MDMLKTLNHVVEDIIQNSSLSPDNLMCFGVSLQPNFLVWSAALVIHTGINEKTRQIALENAREELFGPKGEGPHAPLSHLFFQQLGQFRIEHYEKARQENTDVYMNIENGKILLVVLTCIEMWSTKIMPQITQRMKDYGAQDFYYIDVHKESYTRTDGHGEQFLNVLRAEDPSVFELEKGIQLFRNLFGIIFYIEVFEEDSRTLLILSNLKNSLQNL